MFAKKVMQSLRMVALALLWSHLATAVAQERCESEGIEFGFFNGVDTIEDDAKDVVRFYLPPQYGITTPKSQPITYTLYYNDTEGLSDFVEVFEQRLKEQSDLLDGRFELFFEATRGGGSWWEALTKAMPALDAARAALADAFRAALMRDLAASFIAPPETYAEVSQRHRDQIDHAVGMGRKMLLFAHSQGNLFVNAAYNHAVARSDLDSVRVVHVAPASPGLSGGHTLADLDLVINGLRAVGTVAPITDQIPGWLLRPPGLNGETNLLGHGLLEIYLNPALATAGRIRSHVEAALQALDSAPKKPMPPYPDFVPNAWSGGNAPEPEYSVEPPSHTLERIVSSSSQPVVFRRVQWTNQFGGVERSWGTVNAPSADEGWSRVTYTGRRVNGVIECTWGRGAFWGWISLPWTECRYDRVPLQAFSEGAADELLALGDAPVGTVVVLNSLTFTRNVGIRWRSVPPATEGGPASAQVDFLTGEHPRWWLDMGRKQISSEPYDLPPGQLLNQAAIEQWRNAWNAHVSAERDREQWYRRHRDLYEERRQRCEAVVPPPPPTGGDDTTPCNLPGGPLCTT
jgi:hypothetical protein